MSNVDPNKQKPSLKTGGWVSLGKLMNAAFSGRPDAKTASRVLRTTYEKKHYTHVFPKSIFRREARPILHEDSKKADFKISETETACTFIRNLWFLHQFLTRPRDVVRFLTTTKPDEHRKMFEQRFEELKSLATTYSGWLKAADGISRMLENFKSTKIDLLAASEDTVDSRETAAPSPTPLGAAAVADLIREVEQRASYKAGNADDACEKALYFLALGRPDIAQTIAKEVLDENPDHPVALYANAVLLLDASERHRQQAFIHDIMHPHDLPPLEAEEFYHADRHAEESLLAQQKETQAFLLMLKARQNWPKRFAIKCYDLSPSLWQHKVDEWIFRQAAARVGEDPRELCLPSGQAGKSALKTLKQLVSDIWANGSKRMFNPLSSVILRHFIIVAARVQSDVARDCVQKLETALGQPKLEETDLLWRGVEMVLPISPEPTLAETLIPAVGDLSRGGCWFWRFW